MKTVNTTAIIEAGGDMSRAIGAMSVGIGIFNERFGRRLECEIKGDVPNALDSSSHRWTNILNGEKSVNEEVLSIEDIERIWLKNGGERTDEPLGSWTICEENMMTFVFDLVTAINSGSYVVECKDPGSSTAKGMMRG